MNIIRWTIAALMIIALLESILLLWLLNRKLKRAYGSISAWRFIFAGFIQMTIEVLAGALLMMPWLPLWWRIVLSLLFCVMMVTKIACYVIGFELWARTRKHFLDPKRWKFPQKES